MNEAVERTARPSADLPASLYLVLLAGFALAVGVTYQFGWLGVVLILLGTAVALLTWFFPELWVLALFSSGIFKEWVTENIPLFHQLDFTLTLALLALLSYLLYRVRERGAVTVPNIPGLLTFAIFATYLLLSVAWSAAPKYGLRKAFSFAGFGGVMFLAASGFNRLKSIRRSLWFLFLLGVSTSIYTLVTLSRAVSNLPKILEFYRASFVGVNPISYAQWVGVIAVVSLALAPDVRTAGRRTLVYIGSALMILTVLAANSRGPLLSLLVSLVALGGVQYRRSHSVRMFVWAGAMLALIIVLMNVLPSQLVSRYSDFSQTKTGEAQIRSRITVYQRLRVWQSALDLPTESVPTALFGVGCGAFGHVYYHGDVAWWPHNIFLEVLSEGGLVGLALMLLHWGTILADTTDARRRVRAARGSRDYERVYLAVAIAILFLLVGAQVSGDFSHNRRLWYFLGVLSATNSAARARSVEA